MNARNAVTPPPAPKGPGVVQPPTNVVVVYVNATPHLSAPRERALIRKYGRDRLKNAGVI